MKLLIKKLLIKRNCLIPCADASVNRPLPTNSFLNIVKTVYNKRINWGRGRAYSACLPAGRAGRRAVGFPPSAKGYKRQAKVACYINLVVY